MEIQCHTNGVYVQNKFIKHVDHNLRLIGWFLYVVTKYISICISLDKIMLYFVLSHKNKMVWCLWEEFEDTKGVIRIRKSKKNSQHNDQKKGQKDKQRSTKHTTKTKNRVTRTPIKPEVNSCAPKG
jgi:hypothetical protein